MTSKMKVCLLLGAVFLAAVIHGQSLHVLLLADTENANPKLASACQADLRRIGLEVDSMAAHTGFKVTKYVASGKNFSKAGVQALIGSIKANDGVIFCFYAGMGSCKEPFDGASTERLLAFPDQAWSSAELVDLLESRNARLNIVMLDACGKILNVSGVQDQAGMGSVAPVYKQLLGYRGTLVVCASSCGEYAYADPVKGGVFTIAFIESVRLYSRLGKITNWEAILSRTKNRVSDLAHTFYREQTVVYSLKLNKN